ASSAASSTNSSRELKSSPSQCRKRTAPRVPPLAGTTRKRGTGCPDARGNDQEGVHGLPVGAAEGNVPDDGLVTRLARPFHEIQVAGREVVVEQLLGRHRRVENGNGQGRRSRRPGRRGRRR